MKTSDAFVVHFLSICESSSPLMGLFQGLGVQLDYVWFVSWEMKINTSSHLVFPFLWACYPQLLGYDWLCMRKTFSELSLCSLSLSSCSICQAICLLRILKDLFFPLLYCRSTHSEAHTGVNTVPTSCGDSLLREWGVQVILNAILAQFFYL